MSALPTIRAARAAGLTFHVEGDHLIIEAPSAPSPDLLDAVSRHKAEILKFLRHDTASWTEEDWRTHFHERAGIAEYDGGLGRRQAEELAFEQCVAEWLMRHSVRSDPGACLRCGRMEDERGIVLPFGIKASGHAWLHFDCWPSWISQRRADAVAALATMGIQHPAVARTSSDAGS